MAGWRPMRTGDLASARALETAFHVHHPERPDIAPERLHLAPDWCFVLEAEDRGFIGYGIAHPWGGALPPGLDVLVGALPEAADMLHIHDVVLIEAARGQGHARRLLEVLVEQAAQFAFDRASLIAVGGARRHWARQGFSEDPDQARISFVRRSYGQDCTPMIRRLSASIAAA